MYSMVAERVFGRGENVNKVTEPANKLYHFARPTLRPIKEERAENFLSLSLLLGFPPIRLLIPFDLIGLDPILVGISLRLIHFSGQLLLT